MFTVPAHPFWNYFQMVIHNIFVHMKQFVDMNLWSGKWSDQIPSYKHTWQYGTVASLRANLRCLVMQVWDFYSLNDICFFSLVGLVWKVFFRPLRSLLFMDMFRSRWRHCNIVFRDTWAWNIFLIFTISLPCICPHKKCLLQKVWSWNLLVSREDVLFSSIIFLFSP